MLKEIIRDELNKTDGAVSLISSPYDDCLACEIGNHIFYFIGSEYEFLTPDEAYETFTHEELADMIYDAMLDLEHKKRHYCISVLKEIQERNDTLSTKESKKEQIENPTENLIHHLIEQYNNQSDAILNSKNIEKIHDGDTLLADVIERNVMEQGYNYSGFFDDILNIYYTSVDKNAVCDMFYEFTGIEFNEFLEQALEEQKKTLAFEKNEKTMEI